MDQWNASRAATGTYGQSQYGQQSSGEAQPAATYSYGQASQQQASTPYTYPGNAYGQQSQQQAQTASAQTAAAPASSAYYGYSQQQSYAQPSYGAQTGGSATQSAYGSTATPAYGSATGAQGQAPQGGSTWGQGTAAAESAASGGTSVKYSATSGGLAGQYGGAYGSVYTGAAQGNAQQAAGGPSNYGGHQQQAAPDYGTSYGKSETDPYASAYGSKAAGYGVQQMGGYGQGAMGYDTAGAGDSTNPYASSISASQRTPLQQTTAQQGLPSTASARAPASPAYGHGSATGGVAPSYGRGSAAAGAGSGYSGGAGSAQYGPGAGMTAAGNPASAYQGGGYGQTGAGRGAAAPPYGAVPGYGVAPSAGAAQAQHLVSQYNAVAAAAVAGRGAGPQGGGSGFGVGRGSYGPSGFGGPGPYGQGAPGSYGGHGGSRDMSGPGRDGGYRGSRDRDDQRPSFRRDFDRPRDRPEFRDRDHDRDRDRSDRDRGDRDRDRDRGRDKDKDRDREGSHKRDEYRRDERSSKRDRTPTRKPSYLCKIEPFSWVDPLRDYQNVSRRYSKLYIAPDFCKMVPRWGGRLGGISLRKPMSFEHEAVDVDDEDGDIKGTPAKSADLSIAASKPASGSTVWNAKVMLMSGIDEDNWTDVLGEPKSNDKDKATYIHNLVKFVALRKDRSAIMAPGGHWDPTLDGGDPAAGDESLISAAIRHTKEQTGVDLSNCKTWIRFLDIHYERAAEDGSTDHNEVTAIFVPDVSEAAPTLAAWKELLAQRAFAQKEVEKKELVDAANKENATKSEVHKENQIEEEKKAADKEEQEEKGTEGPSTQKEGVKDELVKGKDTDSVKEQATEGVIEELEQPDLTWPGLLLKTKKTKASKMRSMTISLDGLLDYDEEDREEVTFELSLFAECFHEYLQTEAGSIIHAQLEALRPGAYVKKEEKKRSRDKEKEREKAKERDGDASEDREGGGKDAEAPPERKRSKFSDTASEPMPAPTAELVVIAKVENGKDTAGMEVKEEKDVVKEEKKAMIDINVAPDADAKMEVDGDAERKAGGGDGGGSAGTGTAAETANGSAEKLQDASKAMDPVTVTEPSAEAAPSAAVKEDVGLVKTRTVTDQELLQAYRYFDRNRTNYLKAEDLRRLLHCLGLQLSHRNVKDLVSCAISESGKSRDERVMYRSFTDKEEVVVERPGSEEESKGQASAGEKVEPVKQETTAD